MQKSKHHARIKTNREKAERKQLVCQDGEHFWVAGAYMGRVEVSGDMGEAFYF